MKTLLKGLGVTLATFSAASIGTVLGTMFGMILMAESSDEWVNGVKKAKKKFDAEESDPEINIVTIVDGDDKGLKS